MEVKYSINKHYNIVVNEELRASGILNILYVTFLYRGYN